MNEFRCSHARRTGNIKYDVVADSHTWVESDAGGPHLGDHDATKGSCIFPGVDSNSNSIANAPRVA